MKLDKDPDAILSEAAQSTRPTRNHFRWSSTSGAEQELKTGTMCEAAIVVERQRLITLVLPWIKNTLGMK